MKHRSYGVAAPCKEAIASDKSQLRAVLSIGFSYRLNGKPTALSAALLFSLLREAALDTGCGKEDRHFLGYTQ